MATRRKKASTRVRAVQRRTAVKKSPPKGGRVKPVRKASKAKSKPKASKPKASKAKSKAKRRAAPKPKVKRRKRTLKKRTASVVKKAKSAFLQLRKTAIKKKKILFPLFPKKKGKTPLRGADGQQRDLSILQFWEDVRKGWLESRARSVFTSLALKFAKPPTMYARFTFTVTKVATAMTMGSPKLVRATRKKVSHWFVATPVSYTVEGAMFQFERTCDNIDNQIQETRQTNPEGEFFLEFLTLIAYTVKA
jgi:hypothetical protein